VTLRERDGAPGAPWDRPLHGTLESLVVESDLLAGNPLGDPAHRPLWIYLPPGVERDHPKPLPSVYVIQGYTGQVDMWTNRVPYEPTFVERLDHLFAAGNCPDAVVVLVDAWTSYGGSQFVDSSSTGPYMSYLCDEVVAFVDERYPTRAHRDHRGLTGKSSGGYGAMVVPMLRPDVFGALASHAGDALFEVCHLRDIPAVARRLRDDFEGSYDVFFERLAAAEHFDFDRLGGPLEKYGCAACYSPDPAAPGKALLPFEIETGRLIEDVWQQWLDWDPVRLAPAHADALRSMKRIYLDAGKSDEYYLDLGATAFAQEVEKAGATCTLELFDGTHGGLTYRYPGAIRELVLALAA
jgi:S-formylglutathione hydrolase FrmB